MIHETAAIPVYGGGFFHLFPGFRADVKKNFYK